jgi:hypothetical protein
MSEAEDARNRLVYEFKYGDEPGFMKAVATIEIAIRAETREQLSAEWQEGHDMHCPDVEVARAEAQRELAAALRAAIPYVPLPCRYAVMDLLRDLEPLVGVDAPARALRESKVPGE